ILVHGGGRLHDRRYPADRRRVYGGLIWRTSASSRQSFREGGLSLDAALDRSPLPKEYARFLIGIGSFFDRFQADCRAPLQAGEPLQQTLPALRPGRGIGWILA